MYTVLILDANQRSALAVTRSLGSKGIKVITAESSTTALAGASRYSSYFVQCPSASDDPKTFIKSIAKTCRQHDISMIFPMTELSSSLLLKYKAELPEITLPFTDTNTINQLADKCQLMRLAKSLKIPVPDTIHLSPQQQDFDFRKIDYPLVIKPGKSWLEYDNQWLHTTVRFADNKEQAMTIIDSDPAFKAYPFMLQNCVAGHGEGIFALYNHGEAIAFFAHKRIREKPPRGGVSVLSESVEVNPELKKYAKLLLDHTNWHGVAMVEFKVDNDGTAYLMEVNTRFWGSLQLAIDAGIDFPWLLYQISIDKNIDSINNYTTGIRLRWLLGDLDSLYLSWRDKYFTIKHKTLLTLRFLIPRPFKTRHEVNRLSDLKPFFWELKQYIRDVTR